MGSKVRAKWKQKMMKDKGQPAKKKQSDESLPGSVRKIEKLLKEAEAFVETFDYESARECCRKALRFDAANLKALEMTASVSLDLGDPKTAFDMLSEAVKLSPDSGHQKYFSLGQFCEGQNALQHYRKGIEVATREIEKENNLASAKNKSTSTVEREISNAYCAMAEIYMTDLCFEEDAEAQCKAIIENAIRADSSNPEAVQCLANFQLTTGLIEDAKKSMSESLALWLPNYQALREGQLEETDPAQECPLSFDSRINTSKMLIELEMFDEAAEVLDGLVNEDDEVVDAWYLLGWSNYLRGAEYRGNACFYLAKAKEVAQKVGETATEQFQHVDELLTELGPESEDEDCQNDDSEADTASSDDEIQMEQQ